MGVRIKQTLMLPLVPPGQECDNKVKEYEKGIAEARKKYLKVCKQIGIAGDNVSVCVCVMVYY